MPKWREHSKDNQAKYSKLEIQDLSPKIELQ